MSSFWNAWSSGIAPIPAKSKQRTRKRNGGKKPWQANESKDVRKQYPYSRFKKLHLERKFAQPSAKTFPILELPTELRLQIFREVLVFDEPIELWGIPVRRHDRANSTHNIGFRDFRNRIQPVVGLLRASKLIGEEASEIFYGDNEFRFSSLNAWMVCSAWLRRIQPRHYQFLKHLTIHVPFWGDFEPTQSGTDRCCESNNQRERLVDYLARKGLRPASYYSRAATYLGGFLDCLKMFKNTKLKALNLVIPADFCIVRPVDVSTGVRPGRILENERMWEEFGILPKEMTGLKIMLVFLKDKLCHVIQPDPNGSELFSKVEDAGWGLGHAYFHSSVRGPLDYKVCDEEANEKLVSKTESGWVDEEE